MSASSETSIRPRLSVCMIARDERDVLAESIENVRPIADEIVVLDTGSTDETLSTAEQLGAVTDRMPWPDDFSAARNRCLELATGDWILWLDAGERLEGQTADALRRFVNTEADPSKTYMLLVEVPPAEAGGSAEQMAQIRLMPRLINLRFEGRVRETLRPAIAEIGLSIDAAEGRIIRHPRQHDAARKRQRAQRNLDLAARELAARELADHNNPDDRPQQPARLALVAGEAHGSLDAEQDARAAYLEAIRASERGSTEMLEAYYGLLSAYDGSPTPGDPQLSTCLEALEVFPFDAQLLLAMGNLLQARGRMDLATRSFQTAVEYGQVDLEVWHLCDLAELAADCLGLSLQIQGKDHDARLAWERALESTPDSPRLLRRLMGLHVKHARSGEALELAKRLPLAAEQREPFFDAVRGACRAADARWTPALGYLQSAYTAGCHDPFCLRWLAVTLISNQQFEAVKPVLREWQLLEPANAELQTYLSAIDEKSEIATADSRTQPDDVDGDPDGRQYRVDPSTDVQHVSPPVFPVLDQISSVDGLTAAGAPPVELPGGGLFAPSWHSTTDACDVP